MNTAQNTIPSFKMSPTVEQFFRSTGVNSGDFANLRKCPMFSSLSEDHMCRLLQNSSVQRLTNGSMLFLQGQDADRFYVVLDGWAKLFRETLDGHESVIAIANKGESFAEAAIFERGKYPVSASMVTDGRLLIISAGPFIRKLREDPDIAMSIMAAMSRHLRLFVRKIEQLTIKSAVERLAEFLLRLTDKTEGRVEIRLPLDKALIARHLGMQPETFSRSLGKLRKHGVQTNRDLVTIDDIAAIKKLSGG